MTTKTFDHWKKNLFRGEPGQRFRDRYWRNQRSRSGGSWGLRLMRLILAAVAFVVGAIFAVIPGPAVVFFLFGGALLASDWLWMAKVLDAGEVKFRRLWRRVAKFWHGLHLAVRVILMILGMALSAATTYGFYRLMH